MDRFVNNSKRVYDGNHCFSHENHRIYEEYYSILDFILRSIVPEYDELTDCELYFEDGVGNPAFEYYIKYNEDLPYRKWDELLSEIIAMIYEFCLNSNLEEIFKTISIFLVRVW